MTVIVKWSILERVSSKNSANYCNLYLTEKFYIIRSLDNTNLLNKISELMYKYQHENYY